MTEISKTVRYEIRNGKRIKITKTIRRRIIKKINLKSLLDQVIENTQPTQVVIKEQVFQSR